MLKNYYPYLIIYKFESDINSNCFLKSRYDRRLGPLYE